MNEGVYIFWIDLEDQLSAPAACRQYFLFVGDRHDFLNNRFAAFEHLGYSRMLGAKSKTACGIDANSGKNISFTSDQRATYAATTGKLAQSPPLADLISFLVERFKIIH